MAPDRWEILLFKAACFASCCTPYKWQGNFTSKSPTTQKVCLSSVAAIVATWTTGMALPSEDKIILQLLAVGVLPGESTSSSSSPSRISISSSSLISITELGVAGETGPSVIAEGPSLGITGIWDDEG
jgi:hypothetical protein